jgi:hypothetical protein
MTSARHTSINNANLYIKDASTYHALVKREQNSARHAVGYWESIVVELRTKNRRLTTSSHYYQKPIWALAEYYILRKYQLPEDCTIGTMLHRALSVHDCTDILDKTYQMAADKFTPNEYSTYRSMLDQAINRVYVAAQISAVESLQNDPEIRNAILRILQARGQPLGAGAKRLRTADAETEDDIMIPDIAEDPVLGGTGTVAGTGPVFPDFVPDIPVARHGGAEESVTVATVPTVPENIFVLDGSVGARTGPIVLHPRPAWVQAMQNAGTGAEVPVPVVPVPVVPVPVVPVPVVPVLVPTAPPVATQVPPVEPRTRTEDMEVDEDPVRTWLQEQMYPAVPVVPEGPKRGVNNTETLGVYHDRYNIARLTSDRVAIIVEIDRYLYETYPTKTCNLKEDARTWYQKNVKKVMKCIVDCHGNDSASYAEETTEYYNERGILFNARTYKCARCRGRTRV